MKDLYPRLIPLWLVALVMLIGVCVMQCGCRTGGTWLGEGSAGTVITPLTPQEMNEKSRRETIPFDPQPLAPIPIVPKSNPVPTPPRTTKPTPPKTPPALPKHVEPKIIAGDGDTPIPISPKPKNLPITTPEDNNNIDKLTNKTIINEEDMKVNWPELLWFYFICFAVLVILWLIYDGIKAAIKHKKNKITPIKKRQRKTRSRTDKKKKVTKK